MAAPHTHTHTFGVLLKRSRRAAGLTQEALAARAGYSAVYIRMLESGARTPLPATVALLADALDLADDERTALHAAAHAKPRPASPPLSRAVPSAPAEVAPLVGRAYELALLDHHLLAGGDKPPVLLLAGEPGIGKSRLLREAVQHARSQGWTVLAGGCHRRDTAAPYAPLPDALAAFIRRQPPETLHTILEGSTWLVRLVPELAETQTVPLPQWTLPSEQERRLMFAAVARFLANIAGPSGTLLVLDDLQWAPADALDLLAALVRPVPAMAQAQEVPTPPLRVLAAYRDTEVAAPDPLAVTLAELSREGLATRTALGPLAYDEAAALLDALLNSDIAASTAAAERAASRERVLRRAGGVPYYLVSCAQEAQTPSSTATERSENAKLPWDVGQSIRQRVAVLPPSAQALLNAAAVAGRTVSGDLLLAVLPHAEDDVLAALDAVCQARLLLDEGEDAYRFAHDLVREVVEAGLSATRKKSLHRRLADALEHTPGTPPVDVLAYHYLHGGVRDKALTYALQAGEQAAAVYAHGEAERHYRTAANLAAQLADQPREAAALERLGGALHALGRHDEALRVYEHALARYRTGNDVEGQARVLKAMMETYHDQGTPREGAALIRPRLEALVQQGESQMGGQRGQLEVYFALATEFYYADVLYADILPVEFLKVSERALELASALGDDQFVSQAEWWHSVSLGVMGREQEARKAIERALSLAETGDNPVRLWDMLSEVANFALNEGDLAQYRAYTERTIAIAEQLGSPIHLACGWCARAIGLYFAGAWGEARTEIHRAMALLPPTTKTWYPGVPLMALLLGQLHCYQGDWDAGTRWLDMAVALSSTHGGPTPPLYACLTLAERDLLEGRPADARSRFEAPLARFRHLANILAWGDIWLAWAALELGEANQAEELATEAVAGLRALNVQSDLADALRVRALVALRRGHWQAAAADLDETLTLCRAMPYPYAEAKALYVYGQLHTAKGAPELAREKYEEALAICARLGERLYAEHIERSLAAFVKVVSVSDRT